MARQATKKALLWGAFFVACSLLQPVAAEICTPPAVAELVTAARVIDGDTLRLEDGRRVRLIGIDTPEIGREGRASEPFAEQARERLQALVREPGLQLVVGQQAEDRYGRTLGHLFTGRGANIEALLLADGLGFALAVPPNLALLECHAAAEGEARRELLGVWRQPPLPAARAKAGFQVLRGRIARVQSAGRYLWLELDGPIVLRLALDDASLWAASPQHWHGREVEVRGWVIDRRQQTGVKPEFKPFMLPVRHPFMLGLQ